MNAAIAKERRAEGGRWLAIADEDLAAARLCLAASPPLATVAAYHCQQAAEKITKSLLVAAVWGMAYRYPPEEEGDAPPRPDDIFERIGEIEQLRHAAATAISARS